MLLVKKNRAAGLETSQKDLYSRLQSLFGGEHHMKRTRAHLGLDSNLSTKTSGSMQNGNGIHSVPEIRQL
jgi:hypothetical protein